MARMLKQKRSVNSCLWSLARWLPSRVVWRVSALKKKKNFFFFKFTFQVYSTVAWRHCASGIVSTVKSWLCKCVCFSLLVEPLLQLERFSVCFRWLSPLLLLAILVLCEEDDENGWNFKVKGQSGQGQMVNWLLNYVYMFKNKFVQGQIGWNLGPCGECTLANRLSNVYF